MTDTTPEAVAAALDDHDPISWFDEKDGFSHGTKVPAKWVLIAYSELVRQRATLEALAADRDAQKARADAAEAETNKVRRFLKISRDEGGEALTRAEAAEAKVARLEAAASAVADDVCSYICPSVGREGAPIPHDPRCIALRAALK